MHGNLSRLHKWRLDDKSEDIRGWPIHDAAGRPLGRVDELIVDTERKHVTEVVLSDGRHIPAHDIDIGNHELTFVSSGSQGAAPRTEERMTGAELSERGELERTRGELSREAQREPKTRLQGGEEVETDLVIPLIQEEVEFGKRRIEKGTTRIQIRVAVRPIEQQLHLREERIDVDRRKVDQPIDVSQAEAQLRDESVQVIAITEQPFAEKHLRVVEEVILTKKAEERTERLRENVRRMSVDVREIPATEQYSREGVQS